MANLKSTTVFEWGRDFLSLSSTLLLTNVDWIGGTFASTTLFLLLLRPIDKTTMGTSSEQSQENFGDHLPVAWWYLFVLGLPSVLVFVVARTLYLLHSIRKTRKMKDPRTSIRPLSQPTSSANAKTAKSLKTLVVLGSGGHTTEMLDLIKNLNPDHYGPIVLVVANTDTTSLQRVQAYPHSLPIKNKETLAQLENRGSTKSTSSEQQVYRIPRSREVGQSYASSVFTTLYSFFFAFWLVGYQVRRRIGAKKMMQHEYSVGTRHLDNRCYRVRLDRRLD